MTRSKIRRGLITNIQPSIIFIKRDKKPVDYRNNSFDDFRLMIVDPHPKLESDELELLSNCYGQSTKNQFNEDISKMVLTHLLKSWDQNKTQFHPISAAITLA